MESHSGSSKNRKKTGKPRGELSQYSSVRLQMLSRCLRDQAKMIQTQAERMLQLQVDEIEVGDAMVCRSHRYIQHFAVAVERAIENAVGEPGGPPLPPW